MKFFKWPGSKARAASVVGPIVAKHLEGKSTFVVPFAGSLALTKWLHEHGHLKGKKVIVNDLNDLVVGAWYSVLYGNAQGLLRQLSNLTDKWKASVEEGEWVTLKKGNKDKRLFLSTATEALFQSIRDELNNPPPSEWAVDLNRRPALFLFFNRVCFNGLYREGPNGINVPIGRTSQGAYLPLPDWKEVIESASWIKQLDVSIRCLPFEKLWDEFEHDTDMASVVIYADPPYLKSSFKYKAEGFGPEKQLELARDLEFLNQCGASCILSNSAEFAGYLPYPWQVTLFDSRMSVSCAEDKGKLKELLGVLL